MLINLVKICLVGLLPVLAMPQEAPISTEKIDSGVVSIGGESLPFDSRASAVVSYIMSTSGAGAAGGGGLQQGITGIRIILFTTQPGERITFNMKSDQSKVMMAVYPNEKATKLYGAFKAANSPFASSRAKKLVFTNTSKEPYEMPLVLYGTHGYKYDLTWERKAKK